MKTVRFEDAAEEELIDEIARYELRREGLGTEFLTAVREAVRLVTQNPGAWQASEHGRDVRRFVMDRFPFSISTPSSPTKSSSSRSLMPVASRAIGVHGSSGEMGPYLEAIHEIRGQRMRQLPGDDPVHQSGSVGFRRAES